MGQINITFHGTRGSTPCDSPDMSRYGGNTSCVSLDLPGHDPLLFDLGTGLRYFGLAQPTNRPFYGTCLLSHFHWDHIQGLPFFTPLLKEQSVLEVYAPRPDTGLSVAETMAETIRPPLFPVPLDTLPGRIIFHDLDEGSFTIPSGQPGMAPVEIVMRHIPHVGIMGGYRVTHDGRSVAYLSDHQQPLDEAFSVDEGALALCEGVDVLIHDAQYTPGEFAERNDWGHCTVEYAVWVAMTAKVKTLVLFHHDPTHNDDLIDVLATSAAACGRTAGLEVVAARDGLVLNL
jgi:phosphoribosyl 1,2-cyclic phosphodiesterase